MNTRVLAFCGRKSSGKDTLANFLIRNAAELFNVNQLNWGFKPVKKYALAGPLKDLCHIFLGLTKEQCWGSEEDKNTLTNINWTDLPHYTLLLERLWSEACSKAMEQAGGKPEESALAKDIYKASVPVGKMTARAVLQHIGTEVFRRMNQNCWTDALLRTIDWEHPDIALICDCRFTSEAEALRSVGAKLIRLTRKVSDDSHASEIGLDSYDKFDYVLDNANQTVEESQKELVEVLRTWKWVK